MLGVPFGQIEMTATRKGKRGREEAAAMQDIFVSPWSRYIGVLFTAVPGASWQEALADKSGSKSYGSFERLCSWRALPGGRVTGRRARRPDFRGEGPDRCS